MDRHRVSGRSGLGIALASCTMLLWGLLPHALEVLLARLDAVTITATRFAASAIVLGAWLALRGALPPLGRLPRSGWLLLATATIFLAANYWGYLVGLDWTNAATAQVLIQLAPMLLALGGIFVFGERFTTAQWWSMGLLLAGIGLFFGAQLRAIASDLSRYWSGGGMMLFAAVTWAVYGLAQKQLLTQLSSQSIMLCIYAGCALLFLLGSDFVALGALDGTGVWVLVFAAANTLVGYGTFAAALEHWEASRVSAVLSLTPLATLGFAELLAWWLPERFVAVPQGPLTWIGAAVVVAGSLGVSLTAAPATAADDA